MFSSRLLSFKYALQGIVDIFNSTPNFKIHVCISVITIIAAIFFNITQTEWLAVIVCIGMVLTAESLNTSIEYLTDLVTKDYHELAKKTKDAAAGAVLLSAVTSSIIGFYIFIPYFRKLFFG